MLNEFGRLASRRASALERAGGAETLARVADGLSVSSQSHSQNRRATFQPAPAPQNYSPYSVSDLSKPPPLRLASDEAALIAPPSRKTCCSCRTTTLVGFCPPCLSASRAASQGQASRRPNIHQSLSSQTLKTRMNHAPMQRLPLARLRLFLTLLACSSRSLHRRAGKANMDPRSELLCIARLVSARDVRES